MAAPKPFDDLLGVWQGGEIDPFFRVGCQGVEFFRSVTGSDLVHTPSD